MSAHRAVLLTLLVVGGSLAVVAPPAAADAVDAVEPVESAVAQNTTNGSNASLGADISSFMQSSAAELSGAVETGMWDARFNATTDESERRRLVERQSSDLREEVTALQNRKEELIAARDAGNISEAAYKAQIGRLVGRINALKSAINATEPRARQVNASVDAVESLETDAANLGGPEIAAVARNSSGVAGPPDGIGDGNGGPPENAGGGPSASADNESTDDDSGPPGNAGDAPDSPLGDSNGAGNGGADVSGPGVGADGSDSPGERGPPGDDSTTVDDPVNRTDEPERVGDAEASGPASNAANRL